MQQRLGLSDRDFGEELGFRGDPGRTVRRLKAGQGRLDGPIRLAVNWLLLMDGKHAYFIAAPRGFYQRPGETHNSDLVRLPVGEDQ